MERFLKLDLQMTGFSISLNQFSYDYRRFFSPLINEMQKCFLCSDCRCEKFRVIERLSLFHVMFKQLFVCSSFKTKILNDIHFLNYWPINLFSVQILFRYTSDLSVIRNLK